MTVLGAQKVKGETMKKFATALMFFVLAMVPAFAQTNYGAFTATAPVVLKASAPEQSTTTAGVKFSSTLYSATLPNSDSYMAMVAVYPFPVADEDLGKARDGFVKALNGTIIKETRSHLPSGQPSLLVAVDAKDKNGRAIRFVDLISYQGNTAFQFCFGSYLDVTDTDMNAVKLFFTTASIN
jgi:hypothetical protein